MKDRIRDILPEEMKSVFDAIVEQKVLGASNHIAMVGDMIEALALRGVREQKHSAAIIREVKEVTGYFIRTRGEASQAVSNAIYLMIQQLDDCADEDIETAAKMMIDARNRYQQTSEAAGRQVVDYAVRLAEVMNRIFVYDYSSTVEKFLVGLARNEKPYEIYIAESRIIDGGKPFVKRCQEAGHQIRFIPDAAIMCCLENCDGAFMGAETFYPDGTGFNTTGSDIVALVCRHYGIPLYFLTPLIKLDVRPVTGGRKNLVYDDLMVKLTSGWPDDIETAEIDFVVPELIGIAPEFIKGFVTEKGIIPSGQMYGISMEYSKGLRYEKR